MSEVRRSGMKPGMRKLSVYLLVVAALFVAAIPSVGRRPDAAARHDDPGAVPGAHPSRQDPGRRALRRRRRTAVPRLAHVLQRGRLGARAAQLPRLGRLRHRAGADRQARREGRPAQRRTRATSARTRAASTRATAGRARRTIPRQEARPRARHRRDLAVELRRDPEATTSPSARTRRPRRPPRPAWRSRPPWSSSTSPSRTAWRCSSSPAGARPRGPTPRATSRARATTGWQQLFLKPDASTDTTVAVQERRAGGHRESGLPHRRQRRRPVLRPGRRPRGHRVQARQPVLLPAIDSPRGRRRVPARHLCRA